jgi:protein-tyrosine phosphatase
MIFGIAFIVFGLLLAAYGIASGGWAMLLLWPAGSFLVVGTAYLGIGARALGKRADGRLALPALIFHLPYLLPTWAIWHLARLFSREPCCNEVFPGLWLGRRAFARELPAGVDLVIDLTAEFAAPRHLTVGRSYHSLPTLDTRAPEERLLLQAVEKAASWPGVIYIHCAQGHGRSALLAAAVLVRRGLAGDGREAEAMLRRVRPGVRLTRRQRAVLDRLTAR